MALAFTGCIGIGIGIDRMHWHRQDASTGCIGVHWRALSFGDHLCIVLEALRLEPLAEPARGRAEVQRPARSTRFSIQCARFSIQCTRFSISGPPSGRHNKKTGRRCGARASPVFIRDGSISDFAAAPQGKAGFLVRRPCLSLRFRSPQPARRAQQLPADAHRVDPHGLQVRVPAK